MKRFKSSVKIECRKLFVHEELDYKSISKKFKGHPTWQCVQRWSKDTSSGESWVEERKRIQREKYESLSPQSQAQKILSRINFILNKELTSFNTKDADALAKLQKMMEKIVDKRFQVPMMYEVLTKLINFFIEHYPDLINEVFLNAIKHFKNQLKEDLEN